MGLASDFDVRVAEDVVGNIAANMVRRNTYPRVRTLIVGHPQQARAGLMHLVLFLRGCSSSCASFGLFVCLMLVAVDRGRTCRGGVPASHARRRCSWVGGGEEERLRGRWWGGAGAFEVGRGGATELTTTFSQQREARKRQAPAVDVWAGRSWWWKGRCRV